MVDDGIGADIRSALRRAASSEHPPTLGEVLDGGGQSSFAFALIVLCVPFLQPISLGPLSTVGGLALAALGWQLIRGDARPWLPGKLAEARLDVRQWSQVSAVAERIFRWAGRLVRPRLQHWVAGRSGPRTAGVLIVTAGLLLAVPLAGIPFNNLLPALAIVFAAFALLGRDGLMFGVSVFWLLATVGYFVALYQVFVAMLMAAWRLVLAWPILEIGIRHGWRLLLG
jgi:hypothetical protein